MMYDDVNLAPGVSSFLSLTGENDDFPIFLNVKNYTITNGRESKMVKFKFLLV